MARFLLHDFCKSSRKRFVGSLAFVWSLGLALGSLLFSYSFHAASFSSYSVVFSHTSVLGLLNVAFFPLMASFFLVYLGAPRLLFILIFAKAFSFSFVFTWMFSYFRSAAWLVCPLFLFEEFAGTVLLWIYWLRVCPKFASFKNITPYFAVSVVMVALDFHYVSPFLSSLI